MSVKRVDVSFTDLQGRRIERLAAGAESTDPARVVKAMIDVLGEQGTTEQGTIAVNVTK